MSLEANVEEDNIRTVSKSEKDWTKKREICAKRGYHVVEAEPENAKKVMECYECRIHFTKESADLYEMVYRVEARNGRKNN